MVHTSQIQVVLGKGLTVFLPFFSWFSSSSFPLLVSPPYVSFPPVLHPFSFLVCSGSAFSLALPSLSRLREAYAAGVWFSFVWKRGRGVSACNWTHVAVVAVFGKTKGHFPSLPCIYTPLLK